jgi:hypothetical protein
MILSHVCFTVIEGVTLEYTKKELKMLLGRLCSVDTKYSYRRPCRSLSSFIRKVYSQNRFGRSKYSIKDCPKGYLEHFVLPFDEIPLAIVVTDLSDIAKAIYQWRLDIGI